MLVERAELVGRARHLAYFTVGWNVLEGIVAVAAALVAGSGALLGFGFDSGVESLSGGVLIWRLGVETRTPARAEQVERRALPLIGATFFVLAAFVAVESIRSLVGGDEPDASPVGLALTAVSLIVMPMLARAKRQVGREMGSRSVEADSRQTMACVYLSGVVLVGLALNALFGWWWADPIAALLVVGLLAKEGWEAFHAEGVDDCC